MPRLFFVRACVRFTLRLGTKGRGGETVLFSRLRIVGPDALKDDFLVFNSGLLCFQTDGNSVRLSAEERRK